MCEESILFVKILQKFILKCFAVEKIDYYFYFTFSCYALFLVCWIKRFDSKANKQHQNVHTIFSFLIFN